MINILTPTNGADSEVSLDVTNELALLGGQEIAIGFYLHDAWDGYGQSFLLFDEVVLEITGEGCTELPLCSETSEERCYTP